MLYCRATKEGRMFFDISITDTAFLLGRTVQVKCRNKVVNTKFTKFNWCIF